MSTAIYHSPAGEKAVMDAYANTLAHWPVPIDTVSLSTQQGVTFVITCGPKSAPPLVLLHGAGSNSSIWAADSVHYSEHYRVYAVDLLGEPGKSAPTRPDWDSPAYAEWMVEVLDALKLPSASFIGISQGAWVALEFAVYAPERVQKLVLLAPGGIVPDKPGFVWQALGLSLLGGWGRERLIDLIMGGQKIPKAVTQTIALMTKHFKARVGILPLFTDAELRRLTMPVLLLMGGRDVMRDADQIVTRLRAFVPKLQYTLIPEGGHALLNTPPHILPFLGTED